MRTRFVPTVEAADGARVDFTTPTEFLAGSLRVFQNGLALDDSLDDGFVEGAPPAFEMKVAPRAGDTIWAFYREA